MNVILAQLEHRAKAIVAAVVAAVVTYATAAFTTGGNGLTVHGLEGAAVAALATGLGVHTTVNAPLPKVKRKPVKR